MRRYGLLLIPLAVGLIVLSWVIAAEAQRTPEWQIELNQYLRENDTSALQIVHARQPENQAPSLLRKTVDAGTFKGLALPLPPRDVYCALVPRQETRIVVFVSYFSDNLWRDDWVIHEGPRYPLNNETLKALAALGCDFASEDGSIWETRV